MRQDKKFVVYEIGGTSENEIWLLVHIEDVEGASDWETYQSAIIQVIDNKPLCRYFIDAWLTSMWVSKEGHVFACSMDGTIHYNTSCKWEEQSLGTQYSLNDIWGFDDDNLFCCGLDGALFQKVGESFQLVKTGIKKDFQKIRGNSPKDLYIIGQAGSIIHFDGKKWSELDSPTSCFWMSLLSVSENEVYLCGEYGSLYRGNQFEWNKIDDVEFDLWDLEFFKNRVVVACEEEGMFTIQGNALTSISKDIKVAGIHVAKDTLFTFYLDTIHTFDGVKWSPLEIDFNRVIGKFTNLTRHQPDNDN